MAVLKIYQTFFRRFWAGVIDGLVFLPVFAVSWVVLFDTDQPILQVSWYVIASLAFPAYSIFFHGRFGQTLGKMATRVKVLDVSGDKLTFKQAFFRDSPFLVLVVLDLIITLPYIASGIPIGVPSQSALQMILDNASLLWFWAEVLTMLTNNRRRAVHDFIAGSVVVRSDEESLRESDGNELPYPRQRQELHLTPWTHRVVSAVFTALIVVYVFVLAWSLRTYVPEIAGYTESFGYSLSFAAQLVINISRSVGLIVVSVLLAIALTLKEFSKSQVSRAWINASTVLLVSSIWLLFFLVAGGSLFEALSDFGEQIRSGALVLSKGS